MSTGFVWNAVLLRNKITVQGRERGLNCTGHCLLRQPFTVGQNPLVHKETEKITSRQRGAELCLPIILCGTTLSRHGLCKKKKKALKQSEGKRQKLFYLMAAKMSATISLISVTVKQCFKALFKAPKIHRSISCIVLNILKLVIASPLYDSLFWLSLETFFNLKLWDLLDQITPYRKLIVGKTVKKAGHWVDLQLQSKPHSV